MRIKNFKYDDKDREVLIIHETDDDIYGIDLKGSPKNIREQIVEYLDNNYRHFKKEKMIDDLSCCKPQSEFFNETIRVNI